MALWFDRAMNANGDQASSCRTKLDWLDPKWHGTAEEMLAFGKACRDTKNWRAGITVISCDAYRRYVNLLPPNQRAAYLGSPEILADVKSIYDEYLKHYPADAIARSKYASILAMANHFPEAHAQFDILGDKLTQWPDFPYVPLSTLQSMRDHSAKAGPGPRRGPPAGVVTPSK